MFVAVRMLYREGIMIKPQWPPTVGQIISDQQRGVRVLRLWPVDWVHNATWPEPPTAVLWNPVLVGIGHDNFVVSGLEAVPKGPTRRWTTQKWLCDVLDHGKARDYFKSNRIEGALPSVMPPSPPPNDLLDPFESGVQ